MKLSNKNIFQRSLLFLLSVILINSCTDNINIPVDESSIEIDFPVGKKAVYAVGTFSGEEDSLENQYLEIYSLQFDEVQKSINETEYIGRIEAYSILFNNPNNISIGDSGRTSGTINVTIDNKWVLYQHSSLMGSYRIFMKRNTTSTDTTIIPTYLANQFPILPKIMTPNTNYSIYRPGDDSLFASVQRDFEVRGAKTWNDIYGSSKGLFCKTEHTLFSMPLDFYAIIDSHGIVTSRYTEDLVITSPEDPIGSDPVPFHSVNRRIVDFTEPENVKELSFYADHVTEHGLTLIEEN